jgi:beta-lactamase superfamily II metal-dependent hydrolase
VIDCGRKSSGQVLLTVLQRYVSVIEALVLSHNDEDHIGAAPAVIARYPRAIKQIYRIQDRPLESDKIARLLRQELRNNNLLTAPRSFCIEDQPRELFTDRQTGISFYSVSPTHWDTQEAQLADDPNGASAVIIMNCPGGRIVFAGDSTVEQWRGIERRRKAPVDCEILAVSHHGGKIWSGDKSPDADLEWLYTKAIQCQHAIISVGTSNRFNNVSHPNEKVVSALKNNGANILCTEITRKCHHAPENLRPGVRSGCQPGLSELRLSPGPKKQPVRNVACAGTVVAHVEDQGLTIRQLGEHQSGVDGLCKSGAAPLCRL